MNTKENIQAPFENTTAIKSVMQENTAPAVVPIDLVLTADHVAKDPSHGKPVDFELKDKKNGRRLVFEGIRHAGDPRHIDDDARMMDRIQNRFEAFLETSRATSSEPFVIVEGGIREIPTEESEARKHEMLFTAFLAQKAGVDWESPEPSRAEQAQHLLELGHTPETIVSAFVLRQLKGRVAKSEGVYQESALNLAREHVELVDQLKPTWDLPKGKFPKESYGESVRTWFEYIKTVSDDTRAKEESAFQAYAQELGQTLVKNVTDTLKATDGIELVESINGDVITLDKKKIEDYTHLDDEHIRELPTNKMHAELNRFRDQKIVTEIAKAKEAGKDVFIVFGAYHAIAQKPALEALFQNKT